MTQFSKGLAEINKIIKFKKVLILKSNYFHGLLIIFNHCDTYNKSNMYLPLIPYKGRLD